MKSIVHRDTGESYQEMLVRLAGANGVKTPTRAELIAFDRRRQDKEELQQGLAIDHGRGSAQSQTKRWPHAHGLQARACG